MEIVSSIRSVDNLKDFIKLKVDSFIISYSKYSSCNYKTNKKDFQRLIKAIHKEHKKVIVRLDCLYEENQINEIKAFLHYLQDLEVEYVLLSDVAIKVIIDEEKLNIKTIYAAETLLTNTYDIQEIKNDGFENCVISKNIPIDSVYKICDEVPQYCYLTISGPILMSYSRRRFISTYLGKDNQYLEGYYLSEENRTLKMPIVEKKNGTWFYYCNLQSLKEYRSILSKPFKGVIFDNALYDDDYSLEVIRIYERMFENSDYDNSYKELLSIDKKIHYLGIDDIKLSQLDKD